MTWEQDLFRARDANLLDSGFDGFSLLDVESWWRAFPYRFDGGAHQIVSTKACERRGYGACGDAAASIAAVARRMGGQPTLCVEDPPTIVGKHVRVLVDGVAYDPYSRFRPAGLPETCERLIRL